jgi:peptidoglycan/LPS O-acetylase OafA/YrhL
VAIRRIKSSARGRSCAAPVGSTRRQFRGDVQALRALAVAAVVLYHLWPDVVPGGFVGVDVFFVISGFLITGQLHEEIVRTGHVSFTQFWARRIRRLLPAAFLVLVVSAVLLVTLMPRLTWDENFSEIRAAAAYGENWLLAAHSVDYLGAENSPSLVQHYWSLSVEEQFYVIWPVLLVLAAWLGRRFGRRGAIPGVLVLAGAASLVISLIWTAAMPAYAFFATPTRCWEFTVGGLIAVVRVRLPARLVNGMRSPTTWAGLGLVVVSAFTISARDAYPGTAALAPVTGAAFVIAGQAAPGRWSAARLLAARPLQWLGDTSYSMYLWHWPLIIAAPWLVHAPVRGMGKLLLLGMALALAAMTRRFVEQPLRRRGRRRVRAAAAYAFALSGMVVIVIVTSVGLLDVTQGPAALAAAGGVVPLAVPAPMATSRAATGGARSPATSRLTMPPPAAAHAAGSSVATHGSSVATQSRTTAVVTVAPPPASCVGAAAMVPENGCRAPYARPAGLDPAFAAQDGRSMACLQDKGATSPQWCSFGTSAPPRRTIALIGNSHASRLIPALDLYGKERGWRILVATRIDCMGLSTSPVGRQAATNTCVAWSAAVEQQLLAMPGLDAVIFASHINARDYLAGPGATAAEAETAKQHVLDSWSALVHSGIRVIVTGDVPGMRPVADPECIAQSTTTDDPCAVSRSSVVKPNLLTDLAQEHPELAAYIPLTQWLCDADRCHGLIGGLIVYYDAHHITATFSRSMAPYLGRDVEAVVERR